MTTWTTHRSDGRRRRLWVGKGRVYRDNRVIATYAEYRVSHPDSPLTVDQWEARKLRLILRLEP